jgi:hypothetical protein
MNLQMCIGGRGSELALVSFELRSDAQGGAFLENTPSTSDRSLRT